MNRSEKLKSKEENKVVERGLKLVPILISIVALLYTFISDWHQNLKFEKQNLKVDSLNYILNSLKYKPVLEFSQSPWIIRPQLLLDSLPIPPVLVDSVNKRLILKHGISIDSAKRYLESVKNIKADSAGTFLIHSFSFLTKFYLKNTGNSKATILAYAIIDTFTEEPYLREKLLNIVHKKDSLYHFDFFPLLFNNELQPGSEILVEKRTSLIHLDESIMLHILILYENEIGNIFDSYYWAVFENIPIYYKPMYRYNRNKKALELLFADMTKDKFKCKVTKSGFNIYEKKETGLIDKWLTNNNKIDSLNINKH